MDKNEHNNDESETDILIYIQKRLTKLEKECATTLLIIRDLQNQLRNKSSISYLSEPVIREDMHNITVQPEKVFRLVTLTVPESGTYVISASVYLHSYKCVKFQYLSLSGAVTTSKYNEPENLAGKLKNVNKSIDINITADLQENDTIDVDFYHLSGGDKNIIRSYIEIKGLKN